MNILFVGNSYTFYSDMPDILSALAAENGKSATVDSVTKGGRKLYENLDPEDKRHLQIKALLEEKEYDVLFLQEQSYFALVDYAQFEYGVREVAKLIGAKRNVLYATWGRKSGSELLEKHGWTTDGMTAGLHEAYCKAAEKIGGEVSPVGLCFKKLSEDAPELELYDKDLSHPSYLGSCVAATCHYFKIFGELPTLCRSLKLTDAEVEAVKTAVAAVNLVD